VSSRPALFTVLLVTVPLGSALPAHGEELAFNAMRRLPADVGALSTSGASGALTVPDGRVLEEGTAVLGVNNAIEAQFSRLQRGENYQFGMGFLPYVEISGRLANYPDQQGELGVRDLSANVKLGLPKLFKYQPDIALGINDVSGGASFFRSRYVAVSDNFGPLRLNAGVARGQPYLHKFFGSAELALWNSGVSVLAERNAHAYVAGLRYASAPIAPLANGQIVLNLQRSFQAQAADGSAFNRSGVGVFLALPFGRNERNPRKVAPQDEPVWTPPPLPRAGAIPAGAAALAPLWTASAGSAVPSLAPAPVPAPDVAPAAPAWQALERIQAQVQRAGLERVRVGLRGGELLIEYENHRYNQNEVDAIGIVLGVGATLAPEGVATVSAVTKKSGLALYRTSVDQLAFRRFLRDGDAYGVRSTLAVDYSPGSGGADVRWLDRNEGPRGYSRLRIDPQFIKFVGTELGVLDYSLSLNIQAFVPLWKGAELSTSYIRTLAESDDVAHGFLGYAQQPDKLKAAMVSQTWWLGDRVLNVTSAGKLLYNARGVQHETTWFAPYNEDQVRLQGSYVRQDDFFGRRLPSNSGSASYLWNYRPLGITAELAYNRYRTQDKGPSVQLGRWFGDVQALAYFRSSELDRKVGFSLAFPLTPRQGMQPGWTHLEGSGSFPLKLETRLARNGECNCITNNVVEELTMIYSARNNLLNQSRVGTEYFAGQLYRMREAALIYVVPSL
jgi:hypothetical protein